MKFLQWLFPAHYSEFAVCPECGTKSYKTRMFKSQVHGYFCNEEEYEEWYLDRATS